MSIVGKMGMVALSSLPVLGTLGSQQCSWRAPLSHKGRDPCPCPVLCPQHLSPELCSLPSAVYPKMCREHTPNYSLPVLPIFILHSSKFKNKNHISNFSLPVRNCIEKIFLLQEAAFFLFSFNKNQGVLKNTFNPKPQNKY